MIGFILMFAAAAATSDPNLQRQKMRTKCQKKKKITKQKKTKEKHVALKEYDFDNYFHFLHSKSCKGNFLSSKLDDSKRSFNDPN
jgi:hypothetical protein